MCSSPLTWEFPHPRLAITIGDPAGIGPELVLKAIAQLTPKERGSITIVGDHRVLSSHASVCGLTDSSIEDLSSLTVLDVPGAPVKIPFGQVDAGCGAASAAYVEEAIALAKRGAIEGIVTGPISKESWTAAGVKHIGHTEVFAESFSSEAETVFVVDSLRVFFLSRHVSLRRAIELITVDRVLSSIRSAASSLRWFGISHPRVAVAALNPHAGDGGLFGREEIEILAPAVAAASREGIQAAGPFAADSVFHRAAQGEFDGVLSLFHDQGHIAAKMKSFLGTVAVTTGLPVVRTSVDHGTGFDIAGRNKADPGSLLSAIRLAHELALRRRGLKA